VQPKGPLPKRKFGEGELPQKRLTPGRKTPINEEGGPGRGPGDRGKVHRSMSKQPFFLRGKTKAKTTWRQKGRGRVTQTEKKKRPNEKRKE